MDGDVSRVARPRRDGGWTSHYVHDSRSLLHVRHARSFSVGAGCRREKVSTIGVAQWDRLLTCWSSVLHHRSYVRIATVVGNSRLRRMRPVWRGIALAESAR